MSQVTKDFHFPYSYITENHFTGNQHHTNEHLYFQSENIEFKNRHTIGTEHDNPFKYNPNKPVAVLIPKTERPLFLSRNFA